MDIWDKDKRSQIMSKVHQKDTGPEMIVRKFLFSKGLRYRKNVTRLPGSPDIVLSKYKTVIFINGCFWHGHDCKRGTRPSSNTEYWHNKIDRNIKRDAEKITQLEALNWHVITIWECEISSKLKKETTLNNLIAQIL